MRTTTVQLITVQANTVRTNRILLLLLAIASFLSWSCDSSSPVAPPGTVLTINVSPARIPIDGTAQVRVVARRPNGTPVNPGTLVLFSATIGTIPPSVPVDENGEALTLLTGTGEFGVSTVTASVGTGESVTADVQVGLPAGSISLQASPTSVSEQGGTVSLLALIRDDQGQPLADALVNFRSQIGSLESRGALVQTAADGTVSDELTVTSGDVDQITGDTFQVEVEVGSGSGSLLSTSETITVRRLPDASFSFGINNLTVVFTDTTQGNPTRWEWDFGDGNQSTLQNPTHTYSASGTYVVTLEVTNSQGVDSVSQFVSVSGQ